jgi:hypothetical protein
VDDVARIVVAVQMLLDLVLLGGLVRLLIGAAKLGLTRRPADSDGSD